MSWFIKASSESHVTVHKCMETGSNTEEKSMATVSRDLFTAMCPVTICLCPPVKQSVTHIRLKADPFILTLYPSDSQTNAFHVETVNTFLLNSK